MSYNVQKIMSAFHQFTDGVRVMMLINRGIANSNKGSRRWINKLISTNTDEFESNLAKLLEMQHYIRNPDIRLYSCVNARKLDKAIKYFQHKQLDIADEQEKIKFYSRLNDRFCSALMTPENRDGSLFLLDIDTQDLRHIEGVKMHLAYPTPNGWHAIYDPFNPTLIEDWKNVEIKKDALLLLNTLEQP